MKNAKKANDNSCIAEQVISQVISEVVTIYPRAVQAAWLKTR